MIPVRIESDDRRKCLTIVLDYLIRYFETKIIVCEEGPETIFPSMNKMEWNGSVKHVFRYSTSELFHKTRNINLMAAQSTTPYITYLDSDVLFRPNQYVNALETVRRGELDFCYPFNQQNHNIPKHLRDVIQLTLNLDSVENQITFRHPQPPVGGCLFMNKDKFISINGMNPNMVSWGPEDEELIYRIKKLDYRLGAVPGKLFHVDHDRTPNSSDSNSHFLANNAEYDKVKAMSKEELSAYITTWRLV